MKILILIIALVNPLLLAAYPNNVAKPNPYRDLDKSMILYLVNELRAAGTDRGDEHYPPVGPLQWNNKIELAAQAHSDDMYANDFYGHAGSDGSSLGDRLDRVDYHWSTYGENVAMGEMLTEKTVVDGWVESPEHCKNLMHGSYTEMAVARTEKYGTQKFARQMK